MDVGIHIYPKWPYREVIDAFKKNDIRHTFVNADHPEFEKVMDALIEAQITVDSFHVRYKGQNRVWEEGEAGDAMLAEWLGSVDLCKKYGVELLVGHVSNGRPMPPLTQVGLERFDRYIAYATSHGVKVAFESHRYVENVEFILNRYPQVGFCLDTAHEHAFTPGIRYMPMWGHRLIATHISDNDALCDKDMHMLPFDGIIDFEQTAQEIADSGYTGTLMLEVKPDNHEKYKDISIMEYYTVAAERARKLADMIEKKKQG